MSWSRLPICFSGWGGFLEQAIQNADFQHNRLSPEEKYELVLASKPELLQQFYTKGRSFADHLYDFTRVYDWASSDRGKKYRAPDRYDLAYCRDAFDRHS